VKNGQTHQSCFVIDHNFTIVKLGHCKKTIFVNNKHPYLTARNGKKSKNKDW